MSAGCVRWLLSNVIKSVGRPGYWTSASRLTACHEKLVIVSPSWTVKFFSTEAHGTERTPAAKKRPADPRAHTSISSVGRKIPHKEVQVIDEDGQNLGVMHRADVIRIMDEKELKLVLLSERKEPPVYRLMTGKQIHEEQLRLREKTKARAPPVQVKELTFSAGIAAHDLSTKLKQVENWLEKKHHVKITLRGGHSESAGALDSALEQIVEQMNILVGFVSKPKLIRDGQAATCILRPPSAKELSQRGKSKSAEAQSDGSTPGGAPSETMPAGN